MGIDVHRRASSDRAARKDVGIALRYDASVDVEQLGDSSNWNVAADRPIDVIEHAFWAFFSEIVRVVEFKLSFFIFHH